MKIHSLVIALSLLTALSSQAQDRESHHQKNDLLDLFNSQLILLQSKDVEKRREALVFFESREMKWLCEPNARKHYFSITSPGPDLEVSEGRKLFSRVYRAVWKLLNEESVRGEVMGALASFAGSDMAPTIANDLMNNKNFYEKNFFGGVMRVLKVYAECPEPPFIGLSERHFRELRAISLGEWPSETPKLEYAANFAREVLCRFAEVEYYRHYDKLEKSQAPK